MLLFKVNSLLQWTLMILICHYGMLYSELTNDKLKGKKREIILLKYICTCSFDFRVRHMKDSLLILPLDHHLVVLRWYFASGIVWIEVLCKITWIFISTNVLPSKVIGQMLLRTEFYWYIHVHVIFQLKDRSVRCISYRSLLYSMYVHSQ